MKLLIWIQTMCVVSLPLRRSCSIPFHVVRPTGVFLGEFVMVRLWVRGPVIHYIYESPRNNRNSKMYVSVWVVVWVCVERGRVNKSWQCLVKVCITSKFLNNADKCWKMGLGGGRGKTHQLNKKKKRTLWLSTLNFIHLQKNKQTSP